MIKNPIKDIDYLIMEGTMLSREDEPYKTEKDIESVVNYLRIFHPEDANREFAVELLECFDFVYFLAYIFL